MLTGAAKTKYMRDYMRRKRAGEPTRKPPKPWKPSQSAIDQIERWVRYPSSRNGLADRVLDGLTFDNDEAWMEAHRRYKQLTDERKRERQAERERESQPPIQYCRFCHEPKTSERLFVGDRWLIICERCIDEAADTLAKARAARTTRTALTRSTAKPATKPASNDTAARGLLRLLGIDPTGLSAAEVAEGAEAARRISQCDRVPGAEKRRPQAVADWQAFFQRVAKRAAKKNPPKVLSRR